MRCEAAELGVALDRESFEGLEPEAVREVRTLVWEEQLQNLVAKAKIDLKRLLE